jgi:Flagellar hook-length control protein FliK
MTAASAIPVVAAAAVRSHAMAGRPAAPDDAAWESAQRQAMDAAAHSSAGTAAQRGPGADGVPGAPASALRAQGEPLTERGDAAAEAPTARAPAQPQSAQPQSAQLPSTRPQSTQPESARSQSAQLPPTRPQSTRPQSAQPETARAESAQPESAQLESARPESARPESTQPADPVALSAGNARQSRAFAAVRPSAAKAPGVPDEHGHAPPRATDDGARGAADTADAGDKATGTGVPERRTKTDTADAAPVSGRGRKQADAPERPTATPAVVQADQAGSGNVDAAEAAASATQPGRPGQPGDPRIDPTAGGAPDGPDIARIAGAAGGDGKRLAISAIAQGTPPLAQSGQAAVETATPASAQADLAQEPVVHAAVALVGQGGGIAQVTIHPETLGPVTVQVAMTATGVAHIVIQASTAAGQTAIEAGLTGLQQHLTTAGIVVATLKAEGGGIGGEQNGGQPQSQPQQRNAGHSYATEQSLSAESDALDHDNGVMAYA